MVADRNLTRMRRSIMQSFCR